MSSKDYIHREWHTNKGHEYVATLAVKDLDTGRCYFVDKCELCGTIAVDFTRHPIGEIEHYPQVKTVGGDD